LGLLLQRRTKMGLKHLKIIEQTFKQNPEIDFAPSYFSNYKNIDYYKTLECLQYLWENKRIILTTKGRYKWKKIGQGF